MVGITWHKEVDVRARMLQRLDRLFPKIIEEARRAIELREEDSYVMRKGVFARPAVALWRKEVTEIGAKRWMLENMIKIADDEMDKFSQLPGVVWLEHDPRDSMRTVEAAEELMDQVII